ncbi:hypothetical protein RJ640_006653 [Escallonia rubra]|uniref:ribose-5-phosphate isomerase n=1 Tax=Escallonia rubra TaxID=112253 RepID=A0AA88S903_9ASTE|nr:hypothetical protein RJ640_006653 [Escallonia rubra]
MAPLLDYGEGMVLVCQVAKKWVAAVGVETDGWEVLTAGKAKCAKIVVLLTWIVVAKDDFCECNPSCFTRITSPQDASDLWVIFGEGNINWTSTKQHHNDWLLCSFSHTGNERLLLPGKHQVYAIMVFPLLTLIQSHNQYHVISCFCNSDSFRDRHRSAIDRVATLYTSAVARISHYHSKRTVTVTPKRARIREQESASRDTFVDFYNPIGTNSSRRLVSSETNLSIKGVAINALPPIQVVGREVLTASRGLKVSILELPTFKTVTLHPSHIRDCVLPCDQWVFSGGLLPSSPSRVPEHYDLREAGGTIYPAIELDAVTGISNAVQGLGPPLVSRHTEPGNRRRRVDELGDFLVEREAGHEPFPSPHAGSLILTLPSCLPLLLPPPPQPHHPPPSTHPLPPPPHPFLHPSLHAYPTLTQDDLKKLAAVEYVKSDMVLGLSTGSTDAFVVAKLGALLKSSELTNIVGVPTSKRTQEQATSLNIPLFVLDDHPKLDLAIHDAD